jgi:hypothetical protein
MKTTIEWFNTLQEPYRTQAIVNCKESKAKEKHSSIEEAIMKGLHWKNTLQGYAYWEEVYNDAKSFIKSTNSQIVYEVY